MKDEKRSKYDTNPLDNEYAKRAEDSWGEPRKVEPLPRAQDHWPAEAPTKRYDRSIPVSYPSINVPPTYAVNRGGATVSARTIGKSSRTVQGLGLPENVTAALPYAPFFIGAAAGALELLLTPRNEPGVRSNAAQGLALQLAAVAISIILNIVGNIAGSGAGSRIFWAASTCFFIIATIRAWKGNAFHIPAADDAAQWLDDRIPPQRNHKRQ